MAFSERLGPTFGHQIGELLRPQRLVTITARRVLAGVLTVVGLALMFRPDPDTAQASAVVADHDLAPGLRLTAGDLRITRRPAHGLPAGAVHDPNEIIGHTLAAPLRGGELLTDIRVLGSRLAVATTGTPRARIVPIRPADAGLAELIRAGDRVDVVTSADGKNAAPRARMLATDAVVVLVAGQTGGEYGGRTGTRVILLALPERPAATVAAASLTNALTVLLH